MSKPNDPSVPRAANPPGDSGDSSYRARFRSSSNDDEGPRSSTTRSGDYENGLVILRIVCEAGANILEPTHVYVTTLAKSRFRTTIADKVSLACWELFSNALSYGSVRRPVILELCDLRTEVELRITNEAIPARCQVLEQRVAQLRTDAKGAYLEEMRRSVSGGIPRAMLGLARVAHEVKMDLGLSIHGGHVMVSARCPA